MLNLIAVLAIVGMIALLAVIDMMIYAALWAKLRLLEDKLSSLVTVVASLARARNGGAR